MNSFATYELFAVGIGAQFDYYHSEELNDTDYLIGATNDATTRKLRLCKPDKSPCQDLAFVDKQGAPVIGKDGINDMDGPSVGLVNGNPVMLVNTSKSNTPGTDRIWLARLTGSAPTSWRAEPLDAFQPGADDPGLSRDGTLVVYALEGSKPDSGAQHRHLGHLDGHTRPVQGPHGR